MKILVQFSALVFLGSALLFSPAIQASEGVSLFVLRENSEGTSAQAQPYLDRFLAELSKKIGWAAVRGKYLTRREQALDYIQKERPLFAITSLGAFLALRNGQRLKVIGQVDLSAQGGRQFFLVSKTAAALDQCKGQPVASNHFSDAKFVESVIAARRFRLADFTLVKTPRPVQTLKTVLRDEARCALIDDAQLAAASQIEGGSALKVVWKSLPLPPMPVVAFPAANAQQIAQFRNSFASLCSGEGATLCKSVGIVALKSGSDASYADMIRSYTK
jgi:hypothetical protein